jgi:hypothetical protein
MQQCFCWIIPAHPSIRLWFMKTFVDVKNGIFEAPENIKEREAQSPVEGRKPILYLQINQKGDMRKLAIQMQKLLERKPNLKRFVPAKKLENLKIMSEFDAKDDDIAILEFDVDDDCDQFHEDEDDLDDVLSDFDSSDNPDFDESDESTSSAMDLTE